MSKKEKTGSDSQPPSPDIQLRAFIAVVDCGTCSAAADQLRISSKSIRRYVKAVQSFFGNGLFEGGKNEGVLTERGRIAETAAREAIAVLARARERIAVECPVLRVGFVRMMRPLVERALRRRAEAEAPKRVEFRLFERTSEQQARALERGELDIAICFKLPSISNLANVDEFELSKLPYALAAPVAAHSDGDICVETLRRLHYVHPPLRLSPDVLDAGERWFASKDLIPTTSIECELATQIIAYAGSAIGFGFVPALWSAASREGVAFLPLPDFGARAKISLYAPNHARPHARSLLADLKVCARDVLGPFE